MTRCLRCGRTIEGFAQFCDACQEEQRQEIAVNQTPRSSQGRGQSVGGGLQTERKVTTGAGSGLTPSLINLGFLAVVGCSALAVWLLAFGGAESVGLRKGDNSSDQA